MGNLAVNPRPQCWSAGGFVGEGDEGTLILHALLSCLLNYTMPQTTGAIVLGGSLTLSGDTSRTSYYSIYYCMVFVEIELTLQNLKLRLYESHVPEVLSILPILQWARNTRFGILPPHW